MAARLYKKLNSDRYNKGNLLYVMTVQHSQRLYIENYTFENSNEPRGNLKNDDLCLHKQIILEIDMRRLASSKLSKAKLREVALERQYL